MSAMQGMFASVFAATMSLTVLTFPSPSDLWEAVYGGVTEEQKEIKQLPTVEAYNPPIGMSVAMEDYQLVILACVEPKAAGLPPTADCQMAIDLHLPGDKNPVTIERIAYDDDVLRIAQTFYCRSKWADASLTGGDFDPYECLRS